MKSAFPENRLKGVLCVSGPIGPRACVLRSLCPFPAFRVISCVALRFPVPPCAEPAHSLPLATYVLSLPRALPCAPGYYYPQHHKTKQQKSKENGRSIFTSCEPTRPHMEAKLHFSPQRKPFDHVLQEYHQRRVRQRAPFRAQSVQASRR